ncbi:MAG: murein hydrolase activator EnvC [Desulfovibrionaceae bacterium]
MSKVKEMLELEKDRAERQRRQIEALKTREAELGERLEGIEARMAGLTKEIGVQQARLDDIEAKAADTKGQYERLAAHRGELADRLRHLLGALWPVHLQSLQSRFGALDDWQSVDRLFTWLAAVYDRTRATFAEALEATRQMHANLVEQERLAEAARDQLGQVNALKDRLLQDRLDLRAGLRRVSGEKLDLQQELNDILSVIKDLNYRIDSRKAKRFAENKQLLPWPAQGRVVADFAPRADPPVRGVGLALAPGASVHSVFWGKVVHNDVLRGFGRVIIIYHGNDYYSLYAFLGDGFVSTGQEVEKDEAIGQAGFYPAADGPGLYFELRLGQKAINPMNWLSPM